MPDLDDELFQNEIEIGLLRKAVATGMSNADLLSRQRQELAAGLRKAQEHLAFLKGSPVVVASEYENVRNLKGSFEIGLKKCDETMATNFTTLAKHRVELSRLEALERTLIQKLKEIPNNILEFPIDPRRSEETS